MQNSENFSTVEKEVLSKSRRFPFPSQPPSSCVSERMKHEQILKCLRLPPLLISKEAVNRTYLRKKERPQPKGESFCRVRESFLTGNRGAWSAGPAAPLRASRVDTQPAATFTTAVTVRSWSCLVKPNKFHNPSDEFKEKPLESASGQSASERVCESRLASASAPVCAAGSKQTDRRRKRKASRRCSCAHGQSSGCGSAADGVPARCAIMMLAASCRWS